MLSSGFYIEVFNMFIKCFSSRMLRKNSELLTCRNRTRNFLITTQMLTIHCAIETHKESRVAGLVLLYSSQNRPSVSLMMMTFSRKSFFLNFIQFSVYHFSISILAISMIFFTNVITFLNKFLKKCRLVALSLGKKAGKAKRFNQNVWTCKLNGQGDDRNSQIQIQILSSILATLFLIRTLSCVEQPSCSDGGLTLEISFYVRGKLQFLKKWSWLHQVFYLLTDAF